MVWLSKKHLTFFKKCLITCNGICLSALIGTATASADQLTVADSSGATRTMAELNADQLASVSVQLEKAMAGVKLSLKADGPNGKENLSTTNSNGVAVFPKIGAGKYVVSGANSAKDIASIKITPPAEVGPNAALNEDGSRKQTAAVYLGGLSAAAGGALALTVGGSNSSGSADSAGAFANGASTRDGLVGDFGSGAQNTGGALADSPLAPAVDSATGPVTLNDVSPAPGFSSGDVSAAPTGSNVTTNSTPAPPAAGGPAPGQEPSPSTPSPTPPPASTPPTPSGS